MGEREKVWESGKRSGRMGKVGKRALCRKRVGLGTRKQEKVGKDGKGCHPMAPNKSGPSLTS